MPMITNGDASDINNDFVGRTNTMSSLQWKKTTTAPARLLSSLRGDLPVVMRRNGTDGALVVRVARIAIAAGVLVVRVTTPVRLIVSLR